MVAVSQHSQHTGASYSSPSWDLRSRTAILTCAGRRSLPTCLTGLLQRHHFSRLSQRQPRVRQARQRRRRHKYGKPPLRRITQGRPEQHSRRPRSSLQAGHWAHRAGRGGTSLARRLCKVRSSAASPFRRATSLMSNFLCFCSASFICTQSWRRYNRDALR